MLEIFFLLGFSLHNLEEALWLPAWSRRASRFQREVKKNEFHFAVMVVTALGYMLTFLHLRNNSTVVQDAYYGFILMMCLNVVFPHIAASIALKRYAPGLLTGLMLNLPFGIALIAQGLTAGVRPVHLVVAAMASTVFFLAIIDLLFKLGGKFIEPY